MFTCDGALTIGDVAVHVHVAEVVNRPGYYAVDVKPKDSGLPPTADAATADAIAGFIERILSGEARMVNLREPVRFVVDLTGRFVCWLP